MACIDSSPAHIKAASTAIAGKSQWYDSFSWTNGGTLDGMVELSAAGWHQECARWEFRYPPSVVFSPLHTQHHSSPWGTLSCVSLHTSQAGTCRMGTDVLAEWICKWYKWYSRNPMFCIILDVLLNFMSGRRNFLQIIGVQSSKCAHVYIELVINWLDCTGVLDLGRNNVPSTEIRIRTEWIWQQDQNSRFPQREIPYYSQIEIVSRSQKSGLIPETLFTLFLTFFTKKKYKKKRLRVKSMVSKAFIPESYL